MHNTRVQITVKNVERPFRVEVDPASPPTVAQTPPDSDYPGRELFLDWDRAIDDEGRLRRCPVCGCRELFVRKDFPQVTGFAIVVFAAVIALVLFGYRQPTLAFGVLFSVVLLDAIIFFFTGKCLVCYRCRSEYRQLPIAKDHPKWELAIGEKYRQQSKQTGRG